MKFCQYFAKIQRYRTHFWQKKLYNEKGENVRKIRFRFKKWIV
jgi:hypothetical protein